MRLDRVNSQARMKYGCLSETSLSTLKQGPLKLIYRLALPAKLPVQALRAVRIERSPRLSRIRWSDYTLAIFTNPKSNRQLPNKFKRLTPIGCYITSRNLRRCRGLDGGQDQPVSPPASCSHRFSRGDATSMHSLHCYWLGSPGSFTRSLLVFSLLFVCNATAKASVIVVWLPVEAQMAEDSEPQSVSENSPAIDPGFPVASPQSRRTLPAAPPGRCPAWQPR